MPNFHVPIHNTFQEIGRQRASSLGRVRSSRFIVLNELAGLKIPIQIYFQFFQFFKRFKLFECRRRDLYMTALYDSVTVKLGLPFHNHLTPLSYHSAQQHSSLARH